jgi:hypothetical protein
MGRDNVYFIYFSLLDTYFAMLDWQLAWNKTFLRFFHVLYFPFALISLNFNVSNRLLLENSAFPKII